MDGSIGCNPIRLDRLGLDSGDRRSLDLSLGLVEDDADLLALRCKTVVLLKPCQWGAM